MVSGAEEFLLIDANIWIGYFDQTDSLSDRAKQVIAKLDNSQVVGMVTDFVMQEVVTFLLYKNKTECVQKFLQYIHTQPNIEIVSVDTELWEQTSKFIEYCEYKPKLSFTDWSLLFLGTHFKLSLVTFDKQLSSTYKKIVA